MVIIKAKLKHTHQPDATPVVVCFPVKKYEDVYHALYNAGMGDPVERDCHVVEISGPFEVLSELQGQNVNVDELDYLAKRLDSFDGSEDTQFKGMAAAKGIRSIEDFINLTFCCQQATVISDFSDLRAIGRDHYLNKNGGCALISELDALDAKHEARALIQNANGTVTPYGVVYDNAVVMERLYKGQAFPAYLYDQSILEVEATKKSEPDAESTWLFLPMPEMCIDRALARGRLTDPDDLCLNYEVVSVSSDIFRWINPASELLDTINETAKAIAELDTEDLTKLYAAAEYAEPGNAVALRQLAEQLDLFEFYPKVSTPEEYGRYMIAESGHFEYDAEIDEFYNFTGYGKWRLENEQGAFLESGYICYTGDTPLEELLSLSESHPEIRMTL